MPSVAGFRSFHSASFERQGGHNGLFAIFEVHEVEFAWNHCILCFGFCSVAAVVGGLRIASGGGRIVGRFGGVVGVAAVVARRQGKHCELYG